VAGCRLVEARGDHGSAEGALQYRFVQVMPSLGANHGDLASLRGP
jgi:hypothetical protein